ncbi:hypothetical protein [Microcoleus sp. N9_A1]|uniref:hypothetical protein n=1 Tax=Microcoleus sp. N9_A1 TaxID=3055380 RepID=UPI002FD6D089
MFLLVVISRSYLLGRIVDRAILGNLQNNDGVSVRVASGIWDAGAIGLDDGVFCC